MVETSSFRSTIRRELALASPRTARRRAGRFLLSALLALGWGLASRPAEAQTPYRQELLAGFSGFDVGRNSVPDLVDLDADGDLDGVVGARSGRLRLLANTGTSSAPAFIERIGTASPFAGIDLGTHTSPDLVDLDGDGDLDGVVGTADGTLRYLANTGTSSAPAFEEQTAAANPFDGVTVFTKSQPNLADLDGDGDLDAVIGSYGGALSYFENTGSSSAPGFVARTGTANPIPGDANGVYFSHPELVDLDSDGDLDLFFGSWNGNQVGSSPIVYFANVGSSSAPVFLDSETANPLRSFSVEYGTPNLVDLDGDGDLDAVVGESYGTLRFFKNTGSSLPTSFVLQSGTANPFGGGFGFGVEASGLADLDGDGDRDLVSGSHDGAFLYFKNTGSKATPAFVQQTGAANPLGGFDVGFQNNPELADLDGDGDRDLVSGERYGSLRYFENTGSPSAPAYAERTGGANPLAGFTGPSASRPAIADLDGDGDLDAVVTAGETEGLVFLKNTGSSVAPAFVEVSGVGNPFDGITLTTSSGLELVDGDADGDIDALVTEGHVAARYFENVGTTAAPAFVERFGVDHRFLNLDAAFSGQPAIADLDGDHDLDAIVAAGDFSFFRSQLFDVFADGFESGDVSAWSAAVP